MPPSGEGANLAMFDGSELGTALAAHPDDIEAALTACEEAMFARSAAEAADAHEILDPASATAHRSGSSSSSPAFRRRLDAHRLRTGRDRDRNQRISRTRQLELLEGCTPAFSSRRGDGAAPWPVVRWCVDGR
jgi:2-polyprenyl-6-methoxyphenol hydroxylase-like FAD-dependent oxidoreductase